MGETGRVALEGESHGIREGGDAGGIARQERPGVARISVGEILVVLVFDARRASGAVGLIEADRDDAVIAVGLHVDLLELAQHGGHFFEKRATNRRTGVIDERDNGGTVDESTELDGVSLLVDERNVARHLGPKLVIDAHFERGKRGTRKRVRTREQHGAQADEYYNESLARPTQSTLMERPIRSQFRKIYCGNWASCP